MWMSHVAYECIVCGKYQWVMSHKIESCHWTCRAPVGVCDCEYVVRCMYESRHHMKERSHVRGACWCGSGVGVCHLVCVTRKWIVRHVIERERERERERTGEKERERKKREKERESSVYHLLYKYKYVPLWSELRTRRERGRLRWVRCVATRRSETRFASKLCDTFATWLINTWRQAYSYAWQDSSTCGTGLLLCYATFVC